MTGNTMKDVRDLQQRADAVGKSMTGGCFAFFKALIGFIILGFALIVLFMIFGML